MIYPIVKVKPPKDVVAFVRTTENTLISAIQPLGVAATAVSGRSGVWIPAQQMPTGIESKICAIGIKFANDATMHGMAFNVTTNLDRFMRIIPCGITDAGVTSLAQLGIHTTLTDTADLPFRRLVMHTSSSLHVPTPSSPLTHSPLNF